MCAEYISPLDFKKIFLDYFLGSPELFIFAFIIIFSFAAAKFGMPNKIYLVLLAISSLLFAIYLGTAFYILVLFIVGYISFKFIAKLAN